MIQVVRDSRDVVSSLARMGWAAWRVTARENDVRVKYEDLVDGREEELGRLCARIGVEHEKSRLKASGEGGGRRPAHARAYEGLTAARVGLWREAFERWQVAVIEETAGGLMGEYGYERETGGEASGWARLRAVGEAVRERTIQVALRAPCSYYRFLRPTRLADEERWVERASAAYGRWRSRGGGD